MNAISPMASMPSSMVSQVPNGRQRRYGCIAARIGSTHMYTTTIKTVAGIKSALLAASGPSGHMLEMFELPAGARVQRGVNDITQFPDLAKQSKWVCTHVECRAARKSWQSKEALLAAHEDNRILAHKEETHLYFAVVEQPGEPGQPAKVNDKGHEVQAAVKPKEPLVMLFSDEA